MLNKKGQQVTSNSSCIFTVFIHDGNDDDVNIHRNNPLSDF